MVFTWDHVSHALDVLQFLGIIAGVGWGLYYLGKRDEGIHSGLLILKESGDNLAAKIEETGEKLGNEIKELRTEFKEIATVQAAHAAHIEHLRNRPLSEIRP